jgi:hypothetical protein
MRRLRQIGLAVALTGAVCASATAGDPYGTSGLRRSYSSYDRYSPSVHRDLPNYAPSRRAVEPFTPYYNRPAVFPYYPRYYGSWAWGPYGYRYGFSPWFAPYGPYRWAGSWRIAEVGPPPPLTRLDYSWRVPNLPFEPGMYVAPTDVGRGFPAVPAADPSEECYYW